MAAARGAQGRFIPSGKPKKRRKRKARRHRATGRHSTRVSAYDVGAFVALDKKQLFRDIEREKRAVAKHKAERLRAEARGARTSRKPRIAAVRAICAAERAELRASCGVRRELVRENVRGVVAATRAELAADRLARREMRAAERFGRVFAGPKTKKSAREATSESDDAVRANIDPWLVPYFDHVKRGIRGTAHKSRTEAFLQYVEETPDELSDFTAQHGEDASDAMIAEYEARSRGDLLR